MRRVPAWVWLAVGGLSVFWIMLGSLSVDNARRHDYLNLYTGASLALHGRFADLHDTGVQLELERKIVPTTGSLVPFVRPSFYALLLAPMALLPYQTAFWCWIALETALLAGCWAWSFRRFGPDALVFSALYLPTALGIANGQDCTVLLALIMWAYSLAEKEKFLASGAVLGLMLVKFHLVLLWPVALLVQRRWKMLSGFLAAAAAEVAVSVVLGGLHGARNYIALLQNKDLDRLSPTPQFMISFQGLSANLNIASTAGEAAIVAAMLALFAVAIWKAPPPRLFAAASAGSLLVAPHVYGYDAALLLLGLLLTIFRAARPAPRIAATLLTTPIPFGLTLADKPWAAAASLALTVFLATLAFDRTSLS
jgi:glycosyl transferase family 87